MRRITAGTGSVAVQVAPGRACAYLADPHHAAQWFASVSVDELATGEVREGQRWLFREGARGAARPVELVRLDCPNGFAWQTRLPAARTNIRWEVAVAAEPSGSSTLRMTTRWLPGPLGWPSVLLLGLVRRDALSRRSQRTVERARDALEAAFPAASGTVHTPRSGSGPKVRRGRRR
jgi:Polyketide cyclase / dehydrase and lipid transport